jgi:hypothetical protein
MTDRNMLERDLARVGPAPFGFDDVARRRDRKRRNKRIAAGVLALAVAAAAIGGIVEAIRRAEPSPRPANLPSTPEAWSRLRPDPPDLPPDVSLLAAGPGLVAYGGEYRGAVVWTSSDGLAWTRVPDELGPGQFTDVAIGGPGLVAVGWGGEVEGRNANWSSGALWTSVDGVSWTRLPDDPVLEDAVPWAVSSGGPGLVAVGYGAWFSSDGVTWKRASVPRPRLPTNLNDVTERQGLLVAVGRRIPMSEPGLRAPSPEAAIWTSIDGMSWTSVPIDGDVFPPGSSVDSVTGGPEGFVAIGSLGWLSRRPAVWYSADGEQWRLVSPGQEALAWPLTLNSVTAGDGGYVAVGTGLGAPRFLCPSGNENCAYDEAVVLTSVDGKTWVRVPSAPVFRVGDPRGPERNEGAAMLTVAPWGSRYVSLGTYDNEPAVWIAGPA